MTQERTSNAIGRRIRALRGPETQADFAAKIGVSRAALANYETGRTRPKDMTVLKIANLTGVSPSSIVSDEAYSFDDLAALVANPELKSVQDLTDDERALVRLLRVCDDQVFADASRLIVDCIKRDRFYRDAVDIVNFENDLARLAAISAGGAKYKRGHTRDTLMAIIEAINNRASKGDSSD